MAIALAQAFNCWRSTFLSMIVTSYRLWGKPFSSKFKEITPKTKQVSRKAQKELRVHRPSASADLHHHRPRIGRD
jgi:hypothetical protein